MTARLSVIVATDEYRTIRYLIARLGEQTIRDQLEVVVVSLTGRPVDVDTSDVESFAACRLVELGRPVTLWQARAAGVRIATAPIVQIAETHAFPLGPDWAARVVAAETSG